MVTMGRGKEGMVRGKKAVKLSSLFILIAYSKTHYIPLHTKYFVKLTKSYNQIYYYCSKCQTFKKSKV